MSRLLFDTQALILYLKGTLPRKAAAALLEKPDPELFVSVVSGWEFMLKPLFHNIGLTLDDLFDAILALRATLLPLQWNHIETASKLPFYKNPETKKEHRDPFDRMLIAQAITEKLTLVGGDRSFRAYAGLNLNTLWR